MEHGWPKKPQQTRSRSLEASLMHFLLLQPEKHLLSSRCQRMQKACCLRSWCQVNWFQFTPLLRPLVTSIIYIAWSPAAPMPLTFAARPCTWKMGLAMGLAMSLAASSSVTEVRQPDNMTSQERRGLMELFNGTLPSVL